jgi:hypothetical protein
MSRSLSTNFAPRQSGVQSKTALINRCNSHHPNPKWRLSNEGQPGGQASRKGGENMQLNEHRIHEIMPKEIQAAQEVRAAQNNAECKCKYIGCTEIATEYATGYVENGDDYLFHVCLKHAAEMEPEVFGEKWAAAQRSGAATRS